MSDNRMTKKVMSTLLEIVKLIALSDGNISKEEKQLIGNLPEYIVVNSVEDDLAHQVEGSTLCLNELVGVLTSHEDRCVAARVAYGVAPVSWQPRDRDKINSDERRVYQELLRELNLSRDELEAIESSATQRLNQNRSPIRLILDMIFGGEKLPNILIEKHYYAEGQQHPDYPMHGSYERLTVRSEG